MDSPDKIITAVGLLDKVANRQPDSLDSVTQEEIRQEYSSQKAKSSRANTQMTDSLVSTLIDFGSEDELA